MSVPGLEWTGRRFPRVETLRETGEPFPRWQPSVRSIVTKRIDLADNPSVQLEDVEIEPRSTATVEFSVDGTLSLGEGVLGAVAGSALTPTAIAFSTADSGGESNLDVAGDVDPSGSHDPNASDVEIEIDLEDSASLRLETVDVGVEMTDDGVSPATGVDDASTARDALSSDAMADGEPDSTADADGRRGVIAFTVEGVLEGLAAPDRDALSSENPTPRPTSITFSLDESLESDGGRPADDPILEFGFLVYRVAVRRDGTIVVGFRSGVELSRPV